MKKNRRFLIGAGCLLTALLIGCGGAPGERDYKKALAYWEKSDLVRAQSLMEKALRKLSEKEQRSEAANQLGLILWQLGKYDEATARFTESCQLAEELNGGNLNLAIASYHIGQLDQARFELTKIINEEADHTAARTYLGLVHMARKDWTSAAAQLAEALKINPGNAAAQNAMALTELHRSDRSDAAEARLKKLISVQPDYAPAYYNLAVIAEQWLRKPDSARGWYNQYLVRAGEDDPQVEAARQALQRLATRVDASSSAQLSASDHIAEGTRLHAAGQYQDAIAQYSKAIELDGSQMNAFYNLGLTHYELKQYKEAVEACTQALKINDNFANARYMLALSLARMEEWKKAEREAEKLEKIDPARAKMVLDYIKASK